MSLNPINVFIFFGIFQSAVISLLIVFGNSFKNTHARLLVLLMVVVSVSLLPTFLGNSGLVARYHQLLFVPLHFELFIFPTVYLYISSIFDAPRGFRKKDIFHFFIPGVYWAYSVFIWFKTIAHPLNKGVIAGRYFYFETYSLYPVLLVGVAGLYIYKVYRTMKVQQVLTKDHRRFRIWLKSLAIFFLIGYSLDVASVILGQVYGHWRGTAFDEWLGIPFSILVKLYYAALAYSIATIGYAKFIQPKMRTQVAGRNTSALLSEIINLMEQRKLYLDTNLSLPQIAKELNTTTATVSAILNNQLSTSFNDFVNKYRIEEVKDKLQGDALTKYTLAALAEEAGFKSKATFYRAFQKFTGRSPGAYGKKAHGGS